jgi:hypothetical protein
MDVGVDCRIVLMRDGNAEKRILVIEFQVRCFVKPTKTCEYIYLVATEG